MQTKQLCDCSNPTSITSKVLYDLATIDNLLIEVQEQVFKKKVEMVQYMRKGEEQWKQNLLLFKMNEMQNQKQNSQIFKRVQENIDVDESQQPAIENKSLQNQNKKQKGLKPIKAFQEGNYEKQIENQFGLEIDLNQNMEEQGNVSINVELTEQDGNNIQLEIDLKEIEKTNGQQNSNENNKLPENKKNSCQICFRKLKTKRSLERHMAGTHNISITKQTYLGINGNQILDYLNDEDAFENH